jgi:hypothetical protein
MNAQLYVYLITGVSTLFALLALFAPHKKMGGVAKARAPEPEEDEVIFPEDEDDTMPFIRLPFFKSATAEGDDTQPFRRIANWPN